MNNAIITDRKDRGYANVYALFDECIDHYRTFAFIRTTTPPQLTRKQMNYMLIRSTKYKIPARPTHL